MTHHDDRPVTALRAELLHMMRLGGMAPIVMHQSPLWEIAAALGIHRIETRADHDTREIIEVKAEYWEETEEARRAKLSGYSERRRARERERRQAKIDGAN